MNIFDDEQWLTIERKRYPRSEQEMAEIIDEEFRKAGEFGEFKIEWTYEMQIDADEDELFAISIWQIGEKYGVEINNDKLECGSYGGDEIVKAINEYFYRA